MNYLANFVTYLSLASGLLSISFSITGNFVLASWAILLSVICDGIDGSLARLNPTPKEFGKELDSLSDVITFGVAPVILAYILTYHSFQFKAVFVLFLYLICGVSRLARYNVTPKEKLVKWFYGLPITASGGLIASFVLFYLKYVKDPPGGIILILMIILSFLMISKIKYLNLCALKGIFGGKKLIFFIIALLLGLIFFPDAASFAFFAGYLIGVPFLKTRAN